MESEKSLKTVNEKKEEIKETKPEKYFLRIEMDFSLSAPHHAKSSTISLNGSSVFK